MDGMIGDILSNLFTVENFIFVNIGTFIGIVFGCIPGITGNLAITVLLPFTFLMGTVPALLMLTAIFFGSNFGGSITAILINTPGTNSAAATLLDGYPMARKGQPGRALGMALTASTFGGLVSALSLLFFSPQVGRIALSFAPPEYFALAVFGLSIIASVSGGSILKGLISGCLGIVLAMVGVDAVSGVPRLTFNSLLLYNGVRMTAVLLGVYAIAQLITRINGTDDGGMSEMRKIHQDDRMTFADFKKTGWTMAKSSTIGVIVGAIPGTGSAIASFLAYNEAQRCAKPGERFGEGEIKGIAAPESANNGATASTLIPLLTLGIPGDVVSATLLGAFTMHGLVVGPRLFEESGPTIYAIMVGCVISQFIMYFQGKYLLRIFVKITRVPQELLTAMLMVICCVGAFAIANNVYEIRVMLLFGCVAYFMQKIDLPPVPIVLGMVLGPIAESNLRNALAMSNDSWLIFIQRPICFTFLVLTVVFVYLLKKGDVKRKKIEESFIEKLEHDEAAS